MLDQVTYKRGVLIEGEASGPASHRHSHLARRPYTGATPMSSETEASGW